MQFLPKKEERYLAAMRLAVQKSVLQHGITQENIKRLKKIYFLEAICLENEKEPTDLIRYADILLDAASIILLSRGISVKIRLSGNGIVSINRRRFAAFLLCIAAGIQNDGSMEVTLKENIFSVQTSALESDRKLAAISKAMGTVCLKTADGAHHLFYGRVAPTKEPPVEEQHEWLYLTDGFSTVNVYLENVLGGTKDKL